MNKKTLCDLRNFLKLLSLQKKRFFWAIFLLSISTALSFASPLFPKIFIDYVLNAGSKGYLYLKILIIAMATAFILKEIIDQIYNYLILLIQKKVSFVLELKLFRHVLDQGLSFFKKENTGYIMSRISADVSKLQGLMAQTILEVLSSVVCFIVGLIIALYLSTQLTLMCLAVLPFFIFSIKFFSAKVRNKSKELSEAGARQNAVLQESLSGIYIIKSFLIKIFQIKKLAAAMKKVVKTEIDYQLLTYYSSFATAVIGMVASVLVFWYGGSEVLSRRLTLGSLVSFNMVIGYLFGPAKRLVNINTTIQNSLGALERVYEYFNLESEEKIKKYSVELKNINNVSFNNVSFSYDGDGKVLKNINLDIKKGEVVALVGKSGSGKTTLCNLIPRFYTLQEGEILFNKVNIKNINLDQLRSFIGIVPQDTFIFSGSIEDNIKLGNLNSRKEEIESVCKLARMDEFVKNMPDGYQTELGERGVKISGGQKQRIAIARVLLKKPQIVILDEATSHLDSITEKEVQDAFVNLFENRITFIIAHRLSTARSANKIIVLDEGEIVDQGRHQELYQRCSLYKLLCDLHFSI